MSATKNPGLSEFVGACRSNAVKDQDAGWRGYFRAQRRIMQQDGTLDLASYQRGWRAARAVCIRISK